MCGFVIHVDSFGGRMDMRDQELYGIDQRLKDRLEKPSTLINNVNSNNSNNTRRLQ